MIGARVRSLENKLLANTPEDELPLLERLAATITAAEIRQAAARLAVLAADAADDERRYELLRRADRGHA